MNYMSIGDMAQAYQMRRHNVQLKEHMMQLTQEMTTGETADVAQSVSGDFMSLAGIDRSLKTLGSFTTATSEAALLAATMQTALAAVQDISGQIGPTLMSAATSTSPAHVSAATADAREKFLGAVATLNVQVGDRFVLAGIATDTRPLAKGEDMLADLTAATAGLVFSADIVAAVDAWFDAPVGGGGFMDTAYLGSGTPLAPLRIGPDEIADLPVTGADPAIRDVLKGLALAALVSEGLIAGNHIERSRLTQAAGARVLGAENSMAVFRAKVGSAEAHIDQVAARNSAETTALRMARNNIVAADPYDTATALEAVTAQMETLYTLTARLSRLNFADYL